MSVSNRAERLRDDLGGAQEARERRSKEDSSAPPRAGRRRLGDGHAHVMRGLDPALRLKPINLTPEGCISCLGLARRVNRKIKTLTAPECVDGVVKLWMMKTLLLLCEVSQNTLSLMKNCPVHPEVPLEPKKKGWYCEECEQNVISYEGVPRPSDAAGKDSTANAAYPIDYFNLPPETFPTWIAHPWAAFCSEIHPRVRLYWLIDTTELIVRGTVALALAEVLHAHNGILPESVADSISGHIERPTLGRWLGILRTLCRVAPPTPVVTQGLFEWAEEEIPRFFISADEEGHPENSLLVLRNQVAHGGGLSLARASTLVDAHLPSLTSLLRGLQNTLGNAVLVADGVSLHGLHPQQANKATLQVLPIDARGPWIVGDQVALPLLPLLSYGDVATVGSDGQLQVQGRYGRASQVYHRSSRDRLVYTPIGTDSFYSERMDVETFRDLFQLDRSRSSSTNVRLEGGYAWDDFLREARLVAEDLIGRGEELRCAKAWLKTRKPWDTGPRVGWISAGPGVGKSMLRARLATDYGGGAHRGLFYHRFRGGDARNDRRSFLRLLQSALYAWKPLGLVTSAPAVDDSEGKRLEEDVKARLKALPKVEPSNPHAPRPSFWVFVDGLDEIATSDPKFIGLLSELEAPGTVWLLAGRPEVDLDGVFDKSAIERLFPAVPSNPAGGLPPMDADDIRTMLLEGLGHGRYQLLSRDVDVDDQVRNAFIEAVVAKAHGLPLYVRLLLDDLLAGHFNVRSEGFIPNGLSAYYDNLVDRLGISDTRRDLTQIVAILSQTMEPLDVPGLSFLLANGVVEDVSLFLPRVKGALRAGAGLLRQAPSSDSVDGWTLYHQSFRDYVASSSGLSGSVHDARRALFRAAARWAELTPSYLWPIRNHLFRWGTEYALSWDSGAGLSAVTKRLTDFAYLQARTETLPARECLDLAREYADLQKRIEETHRSQFGSWATFFRERAHLLARGTPNWPANRILLQTAWEHCRESAISKSAEQWLKTGECNWTWLRRAPLQRPVSQHHSGLLAVMDGHAGAVKGVLQLSDHRLISWSSYEIRVWDSRDGTPLGNYSPPIGNVRQQLVLSTGLVLSVGPAVLVVWNGVTGARIASTDRHVSKLSGATVLSDERLLFWHEDKSISLWNWQTGSFLGFQTKHTKTINGATVCPTGEVLTWSEDGTLQLSNVDTGAAKTIDSSTLLGLDSGFAKSIFNYRDGVDSVKWLPDGRAVLHSYYARHMYVWDPTGKQGVVKLLGHMKPISGVHILPDGQVLSWSRGDHSVRRWDVSSEKATQVMVLHDDDAPYIDALRFHAGIRPTLVTFSKQLQVMFLWDASSGQLISIMQDHSCIGGFDFLPDGRIISWGATYPFNDRTVRLWDGETGELLSTYVGHTGQVRCAKGLASGAVLSWSDDGTLRLWDGQNGATDSELRVDREEIYDTSLLSRDLLVGWPFGDHVRDTALLVWNLKSGEIEARLEDCDSEDFGFMTATALDDGRVASWCYSRCIDGVGVPLRVWNLRKSNVDKQTREVFPEYRWDIGGIVGQLNLLPDGRFLSRDFNTLQVWDGVKSEADIALRCPNAIVLAHPLPDGRVVACLDNGNVLLWDLDSGVADVALVLPGVIGALPVSGERVLFWLKDSSLTVWQPSLRTTTPLSTDHSQPVRGAQILHDGQVATWDNDGTVCIWNAPSGTMTSEQIVNIAWSCDPSVEVLLSFIGDGNHTNPSDSLALEWHADGQWRVDHILSDGTVVARFKEEVAILHICHGYNRVGIGKLPNLQQHSLLSESHHFAVSWPYGRTSKG